MARTNWVPLHCHSSFGSLLDGLSKPSAIAKRCKVLGYPSCALTDHGTIHAVPMFFRECLAQEIKPIAGCEVYVCKENSEIKERENRSLAHLCVLAKNLAGWKDLIKGVSRANRPEHYYYKPRLSLEEWAEFGKNWIVFSGHLGSHMANVFFEEPKLAYKARTIAEAEELLHPYWEDKVKEEAQRFSSLFPLFFLEIQLIDAERLPAARVVAERLRWLGKELGLPCVATADSHYPTKEDAADQRVLLSLAIKQPLRTIQNKLDSDEEVGLAGFFLSNNYHIPSLEELIGLHTEEEIQNTLRIAELCETYSLESKPLLPVFDTPLTEQGIKPSPEEHLRHLCRSGWQKKIVGKIPKEKQLEYAERIKMELNVIAEAGLSSYFLIVEDYARYAREELNAMVGPRGSAAGCLISYLSGITPLDPVRFGLIFERFFCSARKNAFPDIDLDFPNEAIPKVIDYLEEKYGKDKVGLMSAFGRLQGRSAIKAVLTAHSRCSPAEQEAITEYIPDESSISDDLQEMLEEEGESSIIKWALENHPDELRDYAYLKEGKIEGPLAADFAQAIRLEGTWRTRSQHASGVVVCSVPLEEVVPVLFDQKTKRNVVGVDMRDAEKMGLVKCDILASLVQTRLGLAQQAIRDGKY